MIEYPPEAICKTCRHGYQAHTWDFAIGVYWCDGCDMGCEFAGARLAGGAMTPTQERELYEKAKRGEL